MNTNRTLCAGQPESFRRTDKEGKIDLQKIDLQKTPFVSTEPFFPGV